MALGVHSELLSPFNTARRLTYTVTIARAGDGVPPALRKAGYGSPNFKAPSQISLSGPKTESDNLNGDVGNTQSRELDPTFRSAGSGYTPQDA